MRSDTWHSVWDGRAADIADWNGMEQTFAHASDYDRWLAAVGEFIGRTLGVTAADDVLDLGCGTARVAAQLAPRARSVTGLDYADSVLSVARTKRPRANVHLAQADLNVVELERFPCTKAYAVGSFLYLNSRATVFRILDHFAARGIPFVGLDLPDETQHDTRARDYDRAQFDHLTFSKSELLARYPTAAIAAQDFMGGSYVNGALRFAFVNTPTLTPTLTLAAAR